MSASHISLSDIGTTREVMLNKAPHGVRNLIMIAAVVMAGLVVGMGFLPVQRTQTISGLVMAADQPRTVTATQDGAISQIGANDGDTVTAGQIVIGLDVSNAQDQLAVIQQQQDKNTIDIVGYQYLRQAALTDANPFDPATQTSLYYSLEQYRQNVAQAHDDATAAKQTQSSARDQAQSALTATQATVGSVTDRIAALKDLAQAVRKGADYGSTDDYGQALYRSWKAGRPNQTTTSALTDGSTATAPTSALAQSIKDYDAAFVAQVEGHVADLETQKNSYSTQVAQLTSQLDQPVLNPNTDPAAAVTATFMLSAVTAEQQLQTQQATLTLQAMSLQLQIDQANFKAPITGVLQAPVDWQVGDPVQAGQQVFQVVPPSGRFIQAMVPTDAIAAVVEGGAIACMIPNDPTGQPVEPVCDVDRIPDTYVADQNNQLYYAVRLSIDSASDLGHYGSDLPAGLPVTLTVTLRQTSALRWIGEQTGLVKQV